MTTSSQYNYEKNFAGFKNEQYTQLDHFLAGGGGCLHAQSDCTRS